MTLDKNTLDKILNLDDNQLIMIIKSIAAKNGIDIKNMNITKEQLASLRSALSGADYIDVKKATEIFKNYRGGK